ncbi:hypothetical protein ACIOG8_15035 [Streptomyces erythrochromogenes]|uniref:hypothetical protein n=1 Tax=Streptomyces erythrochromogenes TaxID=285574 RepID=UPI0038068372
MLQGGTPDGVRNLGWSGTAKTFLLLTGRYWAASSYGRVGRGLTPLTADLVADFSTVLGVPAGILAAPAGVAPTPATAEPERCVRDAAGLLRDARRLTAGQLPQVFDFAEAPVLQGPSSARCHKIPCTRGHSHPGRE